jgi:hypothetical protein
VQEWGHDANLLGVPYNDETGHWAYEQHIATRAAQWGADQELEACLANIHTMYGKDKADWLCSVRRPKPLSLKEQALTALLHLDQGQHNERCLIIRRALEQLDD